MTQVDIAGGPVGRGNLVADETVAAPGRQVEKGTPAARGIDQGNERGKYL